MRFTRQFPVYYCCVLVVPDKINQRLWIIAGEPRRCRSAAESGIARQGGSARRWAERWTGKTGPDRWSRTGATTLRFWGPWLRVFGLNTGVLWSLISRGCAAVAAGVKTLSRPKLNFHWEIEEANMPTARSPSFLLLSFNRIRLLIILWTGLRPYFNLLWRAVEIRDLVPQISAVHLQCADLCFTITLVRTMPA